MVFGRRRMKRRRGERESLFDWFTSGERKNDGSQSGVSVRPVEQRESCCGGETQQGGEGDGDVECLS
jgi:hypothetical protein